MSVRDLSIPRRFLRAVERCDLPPAVVLGTGNTGLSIARSLRARGVPVLGIDGEQVSYTARSSAFDLVQIEDFYGPAVIDYLAAAAGSIGRRPALFCSGDEHVALLSRHAGELQDLYRFELPTASDVEILADKHRFAEVAARRGWPIPQTYRCETPDELEAAITEMHFPAILKPQIKNRETRTHSPLKVFLCETPAQLRDNYRLLAQWEPEVIVQQWIPGGDSDIQFSFHYFDRDMTELAHFEGRKLRQYVPRYGSTSLATGVDVEEVTSLSREILTDLRSVGFCSVEYKRDPRDGRFYIMEPTVGRPNLQVGVAAANGVDLVSIAYLHLIGRSPLLQPPRTSDVKWMLWPEDWRSARWYLAKGQLSWREYLRSISGPKVVAPFTSADYRLSGAYLMDLGGRVWHWALRKLGRTKEESARRTRIDERAT